MHTFLCKWYYLYISSRSCSIRLVHNCNWAGYIAFGHENWNIGTCIPMLGCFFPGFVNFAISWTSTTTWKYFVSLWWLLMLYLELPPPQENISCLRDDCWGHRAGDWWPAAALLGPQLSPHSSTAAADCTKVIYCYALFIQVIPLSVVTNWLWVKL